MLVHRIETWWQCLLNLFYPAVCLGCSTGLETGEELLCTSCRLKLPLTDLHRPGQPGLLDTRFAGQEPVAFVYAYLFFQKKGLVQKLVHALKYRQRQDVGLTLGKWYGRLLREETDLLERVDVVVPVPLHPARLRQRGYNQAACFAAGLTDVLPLPVLAQGLIRTRFTESQTRKDRMNRWENVRSVFSVPDASALEGKRVLLIDDVLTTGATLGACAETLLRAGCRSVGVITLAATR